MLIWTVVRTTPNRLKVRHRAMRRWRVLRRTRESISALDTLSLHLPCVTVRTNDSGPLRSCAQSARSAAAACLWASSATPGTRHTENRHCRPYAARRARACVSECIAQPHVCINDAYFLMYSASALGEAKSDARINERPLSGAN